MTTKKDICSVCAWRADCQKKFSVSGRDVRCPDFVRDMLLREKEREEQQNAKKKDAGEM
jgi:hypothetical protein